MRPRHRVPLMMGTTFMLVALAGCAGSSKAESDGQGSGGQQGGSGAVTITAPKDGADVTAPVTVTFTTKTSIGPTDSGKDHVHVFLDGKKDEYTVVTSSPYTIKNIPAGKHVINVTEQHADHSPAGPSTQITVNVTGGGSSGGDTGGGGGGYDYGNGGGGGGGGGGY